MEPPSPGFRPELDKEQSWLRQQARRIIGKRLRSVVDSQDLSQDAQLSALRDLEKRQFANRNAFRGWLRQILGNRARDVARGERRSPEPGAEDPSWSRIPGRELSPSRILQGTAEHGDLWRKLRKLPERERAVLRLRIVEELSFAELAQRLSISEGNARVIFHRGVQHLRESALAAEGE